MPDTTKWNYDVGGHGWGNNELQYYTSARTNNARVENGLLVIEAHQEAYEGSLYTSARLVTRGKKVFSSGYIEVRAKLPSGRGSWPAIWMLGSSLHEGTNWPACGEIDIMEHVGFEPDSIYGTIHCAAYNHMLGTQKTGALALPSVELEFHTYAIDWSEEAISFYIDDEVYHRVQREQNATVAQWPFESPHYLLVNIAVGGNWGGKQGVDTTIWPQRMEIDWVRVWE